ncbi:MAG: CoA-binding protein [Treponema sp.]|nr:CoA-binding protein [Treponema sp.]
MQEPCELPKATRKRLVKFLQILKTWQNDRIKSSDFSRLTGCTESTVRHDFFLAGFAGGVSNGYNKEELLNFLTVKLGFETESVELKKCCIVGLGRIGAALLDDSIFQDSGFRVGCGFDSSVNRVEIMRSTFPLYPAYEMEWVIRKEKIEHAVLCVPEKDAQNMADRLVKYGIKGIVNMTQVFITVPQGVHVADANPALALKQLLINNN